MLTFLMAIEDEHVRNKLEQLFVLYHKEITYVAYSILKDIHEAEDVVQSAILKLSSKIEQIDDMHSNKTRAFIVIIVRNMAINIFNQRKRRPAVPYDLIDESMLTENESSLDTHLIQLDLAKMTAQKLATIDPSHADIITLRYYY